MTIISSSQETLFAFSGNGEKALILPGVIVAGNGSAIVSDKNNNSLFNTGEIFGVSGETVRFDAADSDGNAIGFAKIFNAAGASIASDLNAITTSQNYSNVNNSGSIQAGSSGVDFFCSTAVMANSGVVNSSGNGVDFSGSTFSFNNSGTVNSETYGLKLSLNSSDHVSIHNSGLLSGDSFAIYCSGDGSGVLNINNSGILDGNVFSGNQNTNVVNTGTIDGLMEFGSGQDAFRNYGTLNGDLDLFSIAGGNAQTVYNRGTIKGDVNLGNGGSSFDGHKGTVTGIITGGSGADTIVAGDDGETMAGGAGHDLLYGGAGADTFAFSSASGYDTDVVHRFNVAQDTIQLVHSAFTHLTAGQTPTFTLGATAASSTDYLFYNSGTGGLYYDTDGSGSHAAYLVATFDKGLNLTAANISVV